MGYEDKNTLDVAAFVHQHNATSGSLKIQEWLTTEEAAAYLRLSVGSLRNLTSNGKVPFHKLGNRNRYWLPELRELLLSQKRGGSSHGN